MESISTDNDSPLGKSPEERPWEVLYKTQGPWWNSSQCSDCDSGDAVAVELGSGKVLLIFELGES